MNAGNLDTTVSLQQPSEVVGGLGDRHEAESFTELATRRAEVKHLRGSELEKAQALNQEIQTKITVRYDSKTSLIKSDCRIVFGEDSFDVMYALPIPGGARSERIEFYCRKNG